MPSWVVFLLRGLSVAAILVLLAACGDTQENNAPLQVQDGEMRIEDNYTVREVAEEVEDENVVVLSPTLKALEDVNRDRLIQGCFGGKDCIPSIDNPKFITATAAEERFLESDDWVIGLEHKDVARAYPLKILNWHEVVNDTIEGDSIAISFCPLCFTGNAFMRVIDGEPTEFGVSGYLINSNLVLYDRTTESLWEQLTGEALTGQHIGKRLKKITVSTLPWSDWREQYPDTEVLSTDTGYRRDYQLAPYEQYAAIADVYFPLEHTDERLFPKELVYGIVLDDTQKAYPVAELNKALPGGGEFQDELGGNAIRIIWQDGSFRAVNLETNREIVPDISFWFAWAAFFPETELYTL